MLVIRRRWIGPLVFVSLVALLAAWGLLGRRVSPRTDADRPVVYTPGVRAVVRYRQEIGRWAALMAELDQEMAAILEGTIRDPYLLSGQVDLLLVKANRLVETVASRKAPASLLGLQEICEAAAVDYLVAAEAVGRWAGAPAEENAAVAWEELEFARGSLAILSSSPWLLTVTDDDNSSRQSPVATPGPGGDSLWGE